MGEIHKASLDGLKLEGPAKEHALLLGIFFPFWFQIFVAFQQKDEKLKSAIIKQAICCWLAMFLCYAGWVWSIKWAMAARDQSK